MMDPIVVVSLCLLGWVSGWVVNYLADVLPVTRSLSRPSCRFCDKPFLWQDYLLLRACPSCGFRRKLRFWVVQIMAVVLVLRLVWIPDMAERTGFWPGLALLIFFGVVAVIDIEHHLILHPVSIAGALLCGIIGVFRHDWPWTLAGGAVGFGFMFVLYWFADVFIRWVRKRRGIQSDEVAMGFGDVSLSGVLGLLLGWPWIVFGLTLAFLLAGIGSTVVIASLVRQRKFNAFGTFIPYGPYLVLSAALLMFKW